MVTGSFHDIVAQDEATKRLVPWSHDDFYSFEVTDDDHIPHMMDRIRESYPYTLSARRANAAASVLETTAEHRLSESPSDLLAEFFEKTMGRPMSAYQRRVADETLEQAQKDDA